MGLSLDSHCMASILFVRVLGDRVQRVLVYWLLVASCIMFFYIKRCTEPSSDSCGSWNVKDDE